MEKKAPEKGQYHAYLLRIWSETEAGSKPVWRFVLVNPQTGKQHGFHSLDALYDYLMLLTQDKE